MNAIDSYWSVIEVLPETGVADLLAHGYGVDQPDEGGETLLNLACQYLRVDSAKLLIARGANINLRNFDGNTPLLCVIDVSNHNLDAAYEIAKALVDAGADIEMRGYLEKTPFLKACSRGCLEILKMLVANGCDIHATTDDLSREDPNSGLYLAGIFGGSSEFIKYVRGLYQCS
ncbi:MAG: hypothetical protein JWN73_1310 [Betaproteobacteria bacterium]|nr:hypothetical protein [Betaproteobacteria bacterium]